MTRVARLGWMFAMTAVVWAGTARAEPPEAQRLFNEARALAAQGRWAEACPRLADSQRLEPNMLTQFRLADCYERTGRTASAWVNYVAAAKAAEAASETAKQQFAIERAAKLEARVDKLVIITPKMQDLEVEHNGRPVPRTSWNAPIPIDPGQHTVHVWAPSKESYDVVIRVSGTGETRRVEVPLLGAAIPLRIGDQGRVQASDPLQFKLAPSEQQAPVPAREVHESSWRPLGWAVGGAGIAAVLVGGALYADQMSRTNPCDGAACIPAVTTLGSGALAVVIGALILVTSGPTTTSRSP